jgi:two-component system, OmpR family, phosphate regulon sensor histidine kinase PhoR
MKIMMTSASQSDHRPPHTIDDLRPALLDERNNPWLLALTQMGQCVMLCDAEMRILWMNDTFQTKLRLDENPYINAPLDSLNDIGFRSFHKLNHAAQKTLTTGEMQTLYLNFKPEGQPRVYFDVNVVNCPNDGAPLLAVVMEDMTKVVLNDKMRRDFVANVSHELRTPLAVIKGYAETLLSGAINDTELARDFVQTMEGHANRLTTLVEELLELSRFEAENMQLPLESVQIDHAIERVLAISNVRAKEKGIHIHAPLLEKPLPKVLAHISTFEQVLSNLLDNAIKYSPNQSHVTLTAQTDGEWLILCVADEGIGIEAKFIPRLFERFYRVDKTRSKHLGGTGLGLSIVKHIVQAHEGDIWVESTAGQGSLFYVKLKRVLA